MLVLCRRKQIVYVCRLGTADIAEWWWRRIGLGRNLIPDYRATRPRNNKEHDL